MDGAVEELYDVAILRDCRRPMAIGFVTDEIRRVLRVPPFVASTDTRLKPFLRTVETG
jgi:hypothetical protein